MSEKNNQPLLVGFFVLLIVVLIESFYLYGYYKINSALPNKTASAVSVKASRSALNAKTLKMYASLAKKGVVRKSTLINQYAGELTALNISRDKKLTLRGLSGEVLVLTYPQSQLSKVRLYKKSINNKSIIAWTNLRIGQRLTITEVVKLISKPSLALQGSTIVVSQ